MKHSNRIIPVLILLLVGGMIWFLSTRVTADNGAFIADGAIEAVEIRISPELGGRVLEVLVNEGDPLKAGDVLVKLDPTLLQAQLAQAQNAAQAAESARQAAQAALDLLLAGPSAEQVAVAQSAVDSTQVAVDAAQEAYDALPEAAVDTAEGKALKLKLDSATAARNTAQAQLDLLKAGARPEQIAAARAQVQAAAAQAEAAQSAVAVIQVQIAKLTLYAPADGVVLQRTIQPGELATPGATLLVTADLSQLTVTVYVPEDRYGQIQIGQAYQVSVDSYPNTIFEGYVVHIADQAEFTPRNIQTDENRKATVYAVKLAVANPDNMLKPGMPAQVDFGN
ncbi:MAG TPA: efflux RND transporter periplasmic adaptor subunit [Anaerolineaceae bacterium]|nr:efflux RND transporter periplasmic adaptor subunit [Anaerolineaceae bacterium]